VSPDEFQLRVDMYPTEQRIVLAGELDYAGALRLATVIEQALAASPGRLVLDLSQIAFTDSSGMRAIPQASLDAAHAGIEMLVIPARTTVQRRFELAGLHALVPFATADHPGLGVPPANTPGTKHGRYGSRRRGPRRTAT
jgi:anti-sigma B factor antagonist